MQRSLMLLVAAALAGVGALACSDSDSEGLGTGGAGGATGGTGGDGDAAVEASATDSEGTGGSGGETDMSGGGAGGGSDAASDTGPASAYCMSSVVGAGTAPLLDDFEDGNSLVPASDGRVGEWSFAKSATAVTMPATGGPLAPVAGGTGGATSKALHVSGTDPMGWGAEITTLLVASEGTGCYDASAYSGIKLSIKGRAGAKVFLIARVATIRAMEATAGHYRKEQVLTADWQEVSLKWADFGPSWGTPPEPRVVDPRELYSLAVLTAPGPGGQVGEFDVWIDSVELTH
jgi:hypothetical protein